MLLVVVVICVLCPGAVCSVRCVVCGCLLVTATTADWLVDCWGDAGRVSGHYCSILLVLTTLQQQQPVLGTHTHAPAQPPATQQQPAAARGLLQNLARTHRSSSIPHVRGAALPWPGGCTNTANMPSWAHHHKPCYKPLNILSLPLHFTL